MLFVLFWLIWYACSFSAAAAASAGIFVFAVALDCCGGLSTWRGLLAHQMTNNTQHTYNDAHTVNTHTHATTNVCFICTRYTRDPVQRRWRLIRSHEQFTRRLLLLLLRRDSEESHDHDRRIWEGDGREMSKGK